MTLKQTLFELRLLISHAFLFQVYNTTDSLEAIRAIYSFIGLNENFTELKSGNKSLFLEDILPTVSLLMGVQG